MPPQTRFDPEGLYARLGLDASAAPQAIAAAYRRKARLFHPDVPGTGNTNAFVAVKRAYDVLANPESRQAYDRLARRAALEEFEPGVIPVAPSEPIPPTPTRYPRATDIPIAVWLVLGVILLVGVVQVVRHLIALPPLPASVEVRAHAPAIAPSSPEAIRNAAYGPLPVRLAGAPNYYVVPASGSTILWRPDEEHKTFLPSGQLPPFSSVQALRLSRQNGMVEVRLSDTANIFIEASRLTPGDAGAARRAYCAYNAGPSPANGEVLQRRGAGKGHLELVNRTTQPAVVKLRDPNGSAVITAFLAPGAHAELEGIPEGRYRPDFAIGELWSRACQGFAAGMRAQRLRGLFSLGALTPLTIPPDLPGEPPPVDLSDQAFERD